MSNIRYYHAGGPPRKMPVTTLEEWQKRFGAEKACARVMEDVRGHQVSMRTHCFVERLRSNDDVVWLW